MTDYTKNINNGTMMIRDTGGNIEFWFKTGSSTWNNQQDWGWSLDGGGWNMGVFKLNIGGDWHHIGTIYVGPGASRQVGMRIVGEGLGWPTTDFFVVVPRSTVPPAPTAVWFENLSQSGVTAKFSGQGDGGSPILEWQLAYGTSPTTGQVYIASNGTSIISGLAQGTTYYFWARGRNALGWGAWSPRSQVTTWSVPPAPTPVTFSLITQNSLRATFSNQGTGGTALLEWELAYGTDPDTPQLFDYHPSSGVRDLTNLDPGRVYYFWARGRNSVGWGPYSPVRSATLVAGARVRDGAEIKRAVPYVNDAGVWKLALPMAKNGGVWKETT